MDLLMPRMDGISAIAAACRHPELAVVAMTSFTQADLVHGALQAGAAGYLLKDAEADEVAAIRLPPRRGASGPGHRQAADAVAGGPRAACGDRADRPGARGPGPGGPGPVQPADRRFAGDQRTDRPTHVSNILSKLEVASRTQAALVAIREGIAPAPSAF